jgi:hypothetical protein
MWSKAATAVAALLRSWVYVRSCQPRLDVAAIRVARLIGARNLSAPPLTGAGVSCLQFSRNEAQAKACSNKYRLKTVTSARFHFVGWLPSAHPSPEKPHTTIARLRLRHPMSVVLHRDEFSCCTLLHLKYLEKRHEATVAGGFYASGQTAQY